jgi:glucosamine-6-phosphate deaminase
MSVHAEPAFRLQIVADYAAMSRAAADVVQQVVQQNPRANLAMPTGSTPVGLFNLLADDVRAGKISLAQARFFCLDEYYPLSPEDPASLTAWLMANFFAPCGVAPAQVRQVPSLADPVAPAAAQYENALAAAGGLDLVILGLGGNGHIAFNEPGSAGSSRTRVLDLTPESIAQAKQAFKDRPVPTRAVSMGVGTLLEARRIVLIVSGKGKAAMLRRALHEPPTPQVPASFLTLAGPRLTVIADADAGQSLDHRGTIGGAR